MNLHATIEEKIKQFPKEYHKEIRKQFLIQLYKKSLFHTLNSLLGYKDVNKRTHGEIIKVLESESTRKLIVCPRGAFKSTIAVVGYSIWRLINNPNLRIMVDSELYTNSKNFIRAIKLHLEDPAFVELFGDWRGPVWNEGEIIIAARTTNLKEASVQAAGMGTTKVGQHVDVLLVDDLNSNNNSQTPEACEKCWDHFKYNMAILEPDGTVVVTATRYSENDLPGKILKSMEQPLQNNMGVLL